MFFFFFILFSFSTSSSPCVHTQNYWLEHVDEWAPMVLNQSMCDISYKTLMFIEPLRMKKGESMYWIAVFHQYCTSQLNVAKVRSMSGVSTTSTDSSYPLLSTIQTVGNSLERYCTNRSQFQDVNDPLLFSYIEVLRAFNNGGSVIPTCNDTATFLSSTSSLYYNHNPDLIIIPIIKENISDLDASLNSSLNIEIPASFNNSIIERVVMTYLLEDTYRTIVVLLSLTVAAYAVFIPICVWVVIFTRCNKGKFNSNLPSQYLVTKSEDVHKNPLFATNDSTISLEIDKDHISSDDDEIEMKEKNKEL